MELFKTYFSEIDIDASIQDYRSGPLESPLLYGTSLIYWSGANSAEGDYWQVTIKNAFFYVNSYKIMTHGSVSNKAHLKSWELSAGINGKNLRIIDKITDNYDLNGANYQHTFQLSKSVGPFNTFRITSKLTHDVDSQYARVVRLQEFEVYGSMRFFPCQSKQKNYDVFLCPFLFVCVCKTV